HSIHSLEITTFSNLKQFTSLTTLKLAGSNVDDEGLQSLLPSLLNLNLNKCANITDKELINLPSRLLELNISNTKITKQAFLNLSTTLTSIQLLGFNANIEP